MIIIVAASPFFIPLLVKKSSMGTNAYAKAKAIIKGARTDIILQSTFHHKPILEKLIYSNNINAVKLIIL